MHWVENTNDLLDFLSYMVLYAPDDFPEEDYLSPSEQMNLEKAFDMLDKGMGFLKEKISDGDQINILQRLLDESKQAYERGDDIKGAHLLQEFEAIALKK